MKDLSVVLTGTTLGIALGITLGPGILRLIEIAMRGERTRAIVLGLGLLGTDLFYLSVAAALFGSPSNESRFETYKIPLAWISFLILTAFAVSTWRSKLPTLEEAEKIPRSSLGATFLSGFVLNLFNPFIPVFWFGAVSYFAVQHADLLRESFWHPFLVFASFCLVTVFLTDLAKVFIFEWIGLVMRKRFASGLDKVRKCGAVLLFLFGLRILYGVYFVGGSA